MKKLDTCTLSSSANFSRADGHLAVNLTNRVIYFMSANGSRPNYCGIFYYLFEMDESSLKLTGKIVGQRNIRMTWSVRAINFLFYKWSSNEAINRVSLSFFFILREHLILKCGSRCTILCELFKPT